MKSYTIEVSEPVFQLLNQQATNQNSSFDNVLERLLLMAPFLFPEANSVTDDESLAALQRLTKLYVDVRFNNLDDLLNDPMIEMANSDLDIDLL